MTTYPGDDPQTPDDPQDPASRPPENDVSAPQPPDGTEPTQPVGYWERRASEQAAEQARAQGGQPYPTTPYPQGGPVFNPTSSQQNPYGQPPRDQGPYAQDPYAQTPYAQNPNARNPYAQTPYSQPGPAAYGGQPAGSPPAPGQPVPHAPTTPYGGYVVRPPDHSQATLALVLGLVGVVGAFIFCGVTLLVSPFAWGVGHSALKDIRASQGRIGGESQARTGMILGIVGTALLILAVLALILIIGLAIASDPSSTTGSSV
jgi:hypothetical protein